MAALAKRAEQVARGAPADNEYLPPLPEQRYPVLPTYWPETAAAGAGRRAAEARAAIGLCQAQDLVAAGLVSTETTRPLGPTRRAIPMLYSPRLQPMSRTFIPGFTYFFNTLSGLSRRCRKGLDRNQSIQRVKLLILREQVTHFQERRTRE